MAREEDLWSIAEIENEAIVNGVAHFGTQPVSLDEVKDVWSVKASRYPWLVAVLDGQVVGFARASQHRVRQAYDGTVEIGIYVAPASQGKGIGAALYNELFPELEARGFRTVLAGIALPNEASIRLHERFGMIHVGTFPMVGFKHGAWRDVGYWWRRLGEDA